MGLNDEMEKKARELANKAASLSNDDQHALMLAGLLLTGVGTTHPSPACIEDHRFVKKEEHRKAVEQVADILKPFSQQVQSRIIAQYMLEHYDVFNISKFALNAEDLRMELMNWYTNHREQADSPNMAEALKQAEDLTPEGKAAFLEMIVTAFMFTRKR